MINWYCVRCEQAESVPPKGRRFRDIVGSTISEPALSLLSLQHQYTTAVFFFLHLRECMQSHQRKLQHGCNETDFSPRDCPVVDHHHLEYFYALLRCSVFAHHPLFVQVYAIRRAVVPWSSEVQYYGQDVPRNRLLENGCTIWYST